MLSRIVKNTQNDAEVVLGARNALESCATVVLELSLSVNTQN